MRDQTYSGMTMTTDELNDKRVSSEAGMVSSIEAKSGSSRLPTMPPSHYTPPKSMPEINTPEHKAAIAKVAEYFAGNDYKLEGASLSEDEMIWLVSVHGQASADDQSKETFGR